MSRGIGTSQSLLLRALLSLEAELGSGRRGRPEGFGHRFKVWAILDRAWALSPDLRTREESIRSQHLLAIEERRAWFEQKAKEGNALAREWIMLDRSLTFHSLRRDRARQVRSVPVFFEEAINPSRGLASLEKRGLIDRYAVQGGGSAKLTPSGRDAARAAIMKRLSVGSSFPQTHRLRGVQK
ncbi:hypothetical protein [Xanthobacter sp. VNH20]|uniref:hypothetical protein n=1 Tax=Xanthobacter sp. VNH20 TaxID=3156616 RepID=UPI0032B54366